MPTEEITIEDLVNWLCEEQGIVLWKDIPGYEGQYQVSNVGGMVRNKTTGRILKPFLVPIGGGYYSVSLYNDGKPKKYPVHRLVAKVWVPNPFGYNEVNHISECTRTNNAANLEWCDHNYNMNFGTVKDRIAKTLGKTVLQFNDKGTLIATYSSATDAQRKTGIPNQNISSCCRGKYRQAGGYIWKFQE